MGTYATTTTLDVLMPGVDFAGPTGSLASLCIRHSESLVNKYLSKRYDVSSFQTATSVPPLVRDLTEQAAEGHMWLKLARGKEGTLKRGFGILSSVKGCLSSIAKYEMDLLDTAGSVITDLSNTSYRVLSNTDTYANTFNEDDPLNWGLDTDKLNDIDSERS